jgi:hypothetical protein
MGDWHEGHASEWGPPPIVKKVIAPQLGQRTRPKPPGVFSPGMSTLTLPTPIAGHSILGPSGYNDFELLRDMNRSEVRRLILSQRRPSDTTPHEGTHVHGLHGAPREASQFIPLARPT